MASLLVKTAAEQASREMGPSDQDTDRLLLMECPGSCAALGA